MFETRRDHFDSGSAGNRKNEDCSWHDKCIVKLFKERLKIVVGSIIDELGQVWRREEIKEVLESLGKKWLERLERLTDSWRWFGLGYFWSWYLSNEEILKKHRNWSQDYND